MSLTGPAKSISPETETLMRANIELMNKLTGFDVVVVCCSNINQAKYWKQRLEKGKGSVIHSDALILTVYEDWPGGAGNGIYIMLIFLLNFNKY
jgi:hypothetical protein